MPARPPRPPADDTARGAAAAALRMLAARELSSRQVRQRLSRKGYSPSAVEAAVLNLTASGALDDGRVARARARHGASLRGHGRHRVLRDVEALGIAPRVAREAVASAFHDVDEAALLERALTRRLAAVRGAVDRAAVGRVYASLVRQGFDPTMVLERLRRLPGAPEEG